jgi:hemolysin III
VVTVDAVVLDQPAPMLKPLWRGRLHTYAFAAALPLGLLLMLRADHTMAKVSVAVYAVSLAAVYGTSAAYHRLANSPKARRRMQRLDHSMIYLLIAGTYTPVCLLALPLTWGIPLLAVVGAGALAGVTLKMTGVERFPRTGTTLYIVMGWVAVVALPVIVVSVPTSTLVLMILGGLAYTIGAIIFGRRRPDPAPLVFGYHEVWHVCTVVAGLFHFGMVWTIAA